MQKTDIRNELNIRIEMTKTDRQPQVTSTIAGDDGKAVGKSQEKTKEVPNKGLRRAADSGWYVVVVRVNCETIIAKSIQKNLNREKIWFDYWIPKVKEVYIEKQSLKRKVKEKLFLSTFIFSDVSEGQLDKIRFRSDVYKILKMPGEKKIYKIPDNVIANYRSLVENDEESVSAAPVPLRKGIKVRIIAGKMKGLEAYVQNYSGKKAIIGNEIKYICGATIEINRDLLEVVKDKPI